MKGVFAYDPHYPTTSWWAVPDAQFAAALLKELPRMLASKYGLMLGPGTYGERGLDAVTAAKQKRAMQARSL